MPMSETEFSRIGLFSSLPGETLRRLSGRMNREPVPAGRGVGSEGEEGPHFFVVLWGVLAVPQGAQGERRMLKAGDSFGGVALVMNIPRPASIRALTPAVIASC